MYGGKRLGLCSEACAGTLRIHCEWLFTGSMLERSGNTIRHNRFVMQTQRHRASAILSLSALMAPLLCAQTVSVWLTTDDRKSLLQPQPDASFSRGTSDSLPTLV